MSARPLLRLAPAGLLAALALLLARPTAPACAPVYRTGHSVRIASERALLIWDAQTPRDGKKGTQHFIRGGTFDTLSPDFGFLVPTPTKPEIKEADDGIFAKLKEYTKPTKFIDKHVQGPPPGMGGRAMGIAKSAPMPSVAVVGQGRVGALDYVTLHSNSKEPKPVLDWLAKHKYSTRPALEEWLKPYLEKGWYLTAFKFAGAARSGGLATRAVRMTFGTDQPYYPYREPEDMRSEGAFTPGRLLRLYVLADERVQGTLGPSGPWGAGTAWAGQLPGEVVKANVLTQLGVGVEREGEWSPWLTEFEDSVSPRYGIDEVYFSRSPDQGLVERTEVREVYGSPTLPISEETRSRLVLGVSIVAGALMLSLAGIALFFFLSSRAAVRG